VVVVTRTEAAIPSQVEEAMNMVMEAVAAI
jgi:hypothetical protein